MTIDQYDAAVIGGSFAGLSAAIYLARGRRRVAVFDTGVTRNRFADAGHAFLGMDGMAPDAMRLKARSDVLAYPTVSLFETAATAVTRQDGGFLLESGAGQIHAKRLILAYGMRDVLPEIDGLAECWGKTVLQCPYCHGYEAADRPTGYLVSDPTQAEHALLLAEWATDLVIFANGHDLGPEVATRLMAKGISIVPGRVASVDARNGELKAILLADGTRVEREILYVVARGEPTAPFAEALGCAMTDVPLGRYVTVDPLQATSVPGVWAAGDITRLWANATASAAEGMRAGVAAHRSLVFGLPEAA